MVSPLMLSHYQVSYDQRERERGREREQERERERGKEKESMREGEIVNSSSCSCPPGAIFTSELSDKTVEGGNTVEFVCAVVASDYQPEIVWIFDSEVITGCNEDSNYCIQNEKVEFARLTTSTFVIETEEEEESSTHLITCYVEQKHTERKMAKLTVKASGIHYCSVCRSAHQNTFYYTSPE